MRVKADFYEPGSASPVRTVYLDVIETKRRLRVLLPSGYELRPKKYPFGRLRLEAGVTLSKEYALGGKRLGRRVVLTWSPSEYQIKREGDA